MVVVGGWVNGGGGWVGGGEWLDGSEWLDGGEWVDGGSGWVYKWMGMVGGCIYGW